jgi:hypothetical protein
VTSSGNDGVSELTDNVQNISLRPLRERSKVVVKLMDDEAEENDDDEEEEEQEEYEEDDDETEHVPTAKAQKKRPPRIAYGKEKHRHQPSDQFYTPIGATMALLRMIGIYIIQVYNGKQYFIDNISIRIIYNKFMYVQRLGYLFLSRHAGWEVFPTY